MTTTRVDFRPAKLDYRIVRGDDFADIVTIREGDPAAAVDVSTRTFTAQVRRSKHAGIIASMAIDMSGAASGEVVYSLPDTTTESLSGTYFWDFQQNTSGVIRTLMGGAFIVDKDVTRS